MFKESAKHLWKKKAGSKDHSLTAGTLSSVIKKQPEKLMEHFLAVLHTVLQLTKPITIWGFFTFMLPKLWKLILSLYDINIYLNVQDIWQAIMSEKQLKFHELIVNPPHTYM